MLDRRRCLLVVLACAGAIVLMLALGCTSAPKAATAKSLSTADAPLYVGGRGQVGRDVGPEITPCDPRCAYRGSSTTLPDAVLAGCYQKAATDWFADELEAGRIIVTPWTGAEAAARVRRNHPQIRYGECPLWVDGAIGPDPYSGCAAGVAWGPSIYVSLGEPARVLALHAWETINAHLAWSLARPELGDGEITAAASTHATATCGTALSRPLATP